MLSDKQIYSSTELSLYMYNYTDINNEAKEIK